MKRVLVVSHSSVVDVYQDKLRELARNKELEITLVVPKTYFEGGRPVFAPSNGANFIVRKLSALFGRTGRQNLHFYPYLFWVLKSVQPHIIHLEEEPESLVTFEAIYLSRLLGLESKIVLFTWRNIDKTHKEWGLLRPQRYIFPFIENYVLRNLDYLIAGNQAGAELFAKKGYDFPIAVIPQYGVDIVRFKKIEASELLKKELSLSGFIIGYVGRLWMPKGISILLKAVTLIERKFTLLILGSGPHKEEFLKLGKTLGIGDKLRVIQSVRASEVVNYLNCMDLLILPSESTPKWKEQFGRVIIEAMACEVPVIGSSSGEIPNVIGDAGLIFQEGNERDLADKICVLMDNSEWSRRLGNLGRERVISNYTNSIIASKLYNIYKELL